MRIIVGSNYNIKESRVGDEPWILISDYIDDIVSYINKTNLLPLSFVDLTPEECIGPFKTFKECLCSLSDIQEIVSFINKLKEVETIYVSCDMGFSRSPAVANGIIKLLDLDQNLFLPPNYHPNPWVTKLFKDQRELK